MAKRVSPAAPPAESWGRIELWLTEHAKPLARSLASGATAAQVRALVAALEAPLPADFQEALAVHDGQKKELDLIPDDGIAGFYFLQAEGILREWNSWNVVLDAGDFDGKVTLPDKGIAPGWWHRGWVPFASNGGGDNLCLDLVPSRGGAVGQVILVRHDDPARRRMAQSFGDWLRQLAELIENGGIDYLIG